MKFEVQSKIKKVRHRSKPNNLFLIFNYVNRFPYTTLRDIQKMLKYVKHYYASISTIHRILKRLRITRKKVKRIVRKNINYQDKLESKRFEFIQALKKKDKNRVISIDESGVHKPMFPIYGYSTRGTWVIQQTTNQRQINYSLIMAINNKHVISHNIVKGATNKEIFKNFLLQQLIPACSYKSYVFLMDNVRFHHSLCVKNIIYNAGHHIMYTPPYSPDLNPVERVFSIIKQRLRYRFCETVHCLKCEINQICYQMLSFDKIYDYSLMGKELGVESKKRIILFQKTIF